jgi:hypothetical protein
MAVEYKVNINVFSGEYEFSRKPFSYYIDFGKEIDLESLKMNVDGDKGASVPVYVIPVAEFKALIYFLPHKKLDFDDQLSYVLTFQSGKWKNQNFGDKKLSKKISRNPNLIPNFSFEKIEKNIERFLTWSGKYSIIGWRLNDYDNEFAHLDNPSSTCRVSSKQAFEGKHSLHFKSGKVRLNNGRKSLVSGSACVKEYIPLKPNTCYQLGFFVKITKRIDSEMNFQGLGATINFFNKKKKPVNDGTLAAFYSIGYVSEENYLNKWVYVKSCEKTGPNTYLGFLTIAEKILGDVYVDMVELREVENCKMPEVVVGKIMDLTPKKKKPVLRRADGTPINGK